MTPPTATREESGHCDWPEQRRSVLDSLARLETHLARSDAAAEVRLDAVRVEFNALKSWIHGLLETALVERAQHTAQIQALVLAASTRDAGALAGAKGKWAVYAVVATGVLNIIAVMLGLVLR